MACLWAGLRFNDIYYAKNIVDDFKQYSRPDIFSLYATRMVKDSASKTGPICQSNGDGCYYVSEGY